MNTKLFRTAIFAAVAVLHITLILFAAFRMENAAKETEPAAGLMNLINIEEELPPPLPPPPIPSSVPQSNTESALAERMIETDTEPPPVNFAFTSAYGPSSEAAAGQSEFLQQSRITVLPILPEDEIVRAMANLYPPIARRSNIEGRVFLELYIDNQGYVQRVLILREDPPDRGFGEAAVSAFRNIRALRPAEADGIPVGVRFRYNLTFMLR